MFDLHGNLSRTIVTVLLILIIWILAFDQKEFNCFMNKTMKTEFDSSSTINILESPRDGKKGITLSRFKFVLGTISVGILGLILGFALAYVMINKENQIEGQHNIGNEKKPGKLIYVLYSGVQLKCNTYYICKPYIPAT